MLSEHDVPIAPSTYFARRAQGFVTQAAWDDAHMANRLHDLWLANRGLYGAEKLWTAALDDGLAVGRDQVARLMRILGIEGVRRGRHRTTTTTADPKVLNPPGSGGHPGVLDSNQLPGAILGSLLAWLAQSVDEDLLVRSALRL